MDAKLQDALVRDFPVINRDYGGDPRKTCMAWGYEVGDGWEPLLRRTFEQLSRLDPPPVLEQVKEKYGSLRIYLCGGPEIRPRAAWLVGLWGALCALVAAPWRVVRPRWRWDVRQAFNLRHAARHAIFVATSFPAEDIVDAAEAESYRICEACGQPGRPNDIGWISVRCDSCRQAEAAERERRMAEYRKREDGNAAP
jgi:hypothetical protein